MILEIESTINNVPCYTISDSSNTIVAICLSKDLAIFICNSQEKWSIKKAILTNIDFLEENVALYVNA